MQLRIDDAQRKVRNEIRSYFAGLTPPEVARQLEAESGHLGPVGRKLVRQMGSDGWLGIGWPAEYGGRNLTAIEQFIFFDEANRARIPLPLVTLNTVAPTLIRYGSDEQRHRYLPGILLGEIEFAIGYSEPVSGTDLAALATKARRDGDEFVINGAKIFTSGGDTADYIWLAARTGTPEERHRGITIFIVPTSSPGFSTTPIDTIGGGRTTASFYDDVRVPAENIVLGENQGWRLITTQLNNERVAMAASSGRWIKLYEDVVEWAANEKRSDGTRVIDLPWVQLALARAHALCESVRITNLRMAAAVASDVLQPADSSTAKIIGTESRQEVARTLLEIVGQPAYLKVGSTGAVLRGQIEEEARNIFVGTFGGGTNEIQREIIAWSGLGMPRGAR